MGERAIALGFLAASAIYLAMSVAFPLGTAARPGAGFFPVAVGAFLTVVAVVFVAAVFRGQAAVARWSAQPLPGDARWRVGTTIAVVVGFCLLLPWLGYPVTAFLFVALLLRALGAGGWLMPVLAAALGAAASYYLFAVLLAVPLPRGVLLD